MSKLVLRFLKDKYGLIAVGIAVALFGAVGLTDTPVKELFKLHANIPIAQ